MIVFHEGLPRSGKSYEACVYQILEAIKSGRRVVTNIEGINYAQFSELSGVPENFVKQNLVNIYSTDLEEVRASILSESKQDSLIVIDEIQNLFPSERQKLSEEWSVYITEHGHKGLDIILMGQDRRDCHAIWRRRIQRVILFTKLSAIGKDDSYKWVVFEAERPEKFVKINSGVRKYENKYFGLYKSHSAGTENKSNHLDKRANIFTSKLFKVGIPSVVLVVCAAFYFLNSFFNPVAADESKTTTTHENGVTKTVTVEKINPNAYQASVPVVPIEPEPLDIFDETIGGNRLRLSAFIQYESEEGANYSGYIDIIDSSFHIKDRYNPQELLALGWKVEVKTYGLQLTKEDTVHIARPWPIDKFGQVDNATRQQL